MDEWILTKVQVQGPFPEWGLPDEVTDEKDLSNAPISFYLQLAISAG